MSARDGGVWQSLIEAAPDEESARTVYRLTEEPWFADAVCAALAASAPPPPPLDVERLARAMKEYGGNDRQRLVLPVSRLHEVARAIASAYEEAGS